MAEPPAKVLLVGMMGAGKTTVGQALARRLGWRYLDSDAEVQRRTGRTIPEIWRADGEAAFRRQEAEVLAEAVGGDDAVVVSVAGGAVLDPGNREAITSSGALVAYLRASVDTLAVRVGDGRGRPLLDGDPRGSITRLLPEREPFYEALASVVIDVDGRRVDDVCDEIEAALAARGGRA